MIFSVGIYDISVYQLIDLVVRQYSWLNAMEVITDKNGLTVFAIIFTNLKSNKKR